MTYFHRSNFRRFSVSTPSAAVRASIAPRIAAEAETQLLLQDEPAVEGERKTETLAD